MFTRHIKTVARKLTTAPVRKPAKARKARLGLESLERRDMPAFLLAGTAGNDIFTFGVDGSGATTVQVNAQAPVVIPANETQSIEIQGLGGNDTFNLAGLGTRVLPTTLTINCGEGDDLVNGSTYQGRMVLLGRAGDDSLTAGAGDDELHADDGNDVVYGGAGDDMLSAAAGDDRVDGEDGDDEVYGGDGNDELYGGTGQDWMEGQAGDDAMWGEEDGDWVHGDAGKDRIVGGDGNDLLVGGDGNDEMHADEGNDVLVGGAGDDMLSGAAGDDRLRGNDGDDEVYGGDGSDELYGGPGQDWMEGQAGDDAMWGDDDNDWMFGNAGADQLYGGNGNDQLNGGDGNDRLYGGSGQDDLQGGAGTNMLWTDAAPNAAATGSLVLTPGQTIASPNGQFTLTLQTDGNLVLHGPGRQPLWASVTTWGQNVTRAVMQYNGDFVIYGPRNADGSHQELWSTGTAGNDGATLELRDDGDLVVVKNGTVLKSTNTAGGWTAGGTLLVGQAVASPNGRYTLTLQTDGNLVLHGPGRQPLWASVSTWGRNVTRAVMQYNGDFVIYGPKNADGTNARLWSTGTSGRAGAALEVRDDGNVVVVRDGVVFWSTNTTQPGATGTGGTTLPGSTTGGTTSSGSTTTGGTSTTTGGTTTGGSTGGGTGTTTASGAGVVAVGTLRGSGGGASGTGLVPSQAMLGGGGSPPPSPTGSYPSSVSSVGTMDSGFGGRWTGGAPQYAPPTGSPTSSIRAPSWAYTPPASPTNAGGPSSAGPSITPRPASPTPAPRPPSPAPAPRPVSPTPAPRPLPGIGRVGASRVGAGIGFLLDTLARILPTVSSWANSALSAVGGWINNTASSLGNRIGGWLGQGITAAGNWIGNAATTVGGWVQTAGQAIGNFWNSLFRR